MNNELNNEIKLNLNNLIESVDNLEDQNYFEILNLIYYNNNFSDNKEIHALLNYLIIKLHYKFDAERNSQ